MLRRRSRNPGRAGAAVGAAACCWLLACGDPPTRPEQEERILFASTRDNVGGEVYSMRPDGSGVVRLTTTEGGRFSTSPTWYDGHRRIAFLSNRGEVQETGAYTMASDGSDVRRVPAVLPAIPMSRPVPSPDGSRLAFTSGPDIWVIGMDGSGLTRLTDDLSVDRAPQWSPDGARIAFISRRTGSAQVWVMNADGTGVRRVTEIADAVFSYATWSPDGARLALVQGSFEGGIAVINADGTGYRLLTPVESFNLNPSWSPDGRRIAFSGIGPSAAPFDDEDIQIITADGSSFTRLGARGSDLAPSWR